MAQKRKSIDAVEDCGAAMCANGCGFFGNAATGGMCSKCYREHAAGATETSSTTTAEKKTHQAVIDTTPPPAPLRTLTTAPAEKKAKIAYAAAAVAWSSSSPDGGADAVAARAPSTELPKPAANRCSACRKKVGLLGFRCCCGETFCGEHRYAEKHACGFDYKSAGRERLAKNNPVVIADKIAKI